jgi:actin-related protein
VVDIGAEYTHVVPVVEGFIHNKGIIRANIGGETITRELYRHSLVNGHYKNGFSNQDRLTDKMKEWGCMELMR